MTDDINYADIAAAVVAAVGQRGPQGRLTADELDAVLAEGGAQPTPPGRKGRAEWVNLRVKIRQRFNKIIAAKHGASLEVVGHVAAARRGGWETIYGLVTLPDTVVSKPFRLSERFYRQVIRHFEHIKTAFEAETPPPPGLDEEALNRWRELNSRRFKRLMQDVFDSLEQAAIEAGLKKHIPVFSADIIRLREGKRRSKNAA